MNKAMHRAAHLLEQFVKMFLALFPADDGLQAKTVTARIRAHFPEQQVAMVQIFRRRLQQKKTPIRLDKPLHQNWDRGLRANVEENVAEVAQTMFDQGGN